MDTIHVLKRVADQPAWDQMAEPLSRAVHGAFDSAGPAGEQAKNLAHGVWLGHPLHPVLTDIPIGAWTTALALDAAGDGDAGMRRAATFALGVGLVGALGSAVTGLADWSETHGPSRRLGLVHGLLNVVATSLVAAAFFRRRRDPRANGRACAWSGFAVATASAYLGGELVYGQRIGVTHADAEPPEAFTAVADSAAVRENTMMRADAEGADILLARQHGRVCALVHSCAHLGGPLSEGTLRDGSVVCPWHGSEFALEDGRVLRGPSAHSQPCLTVRERDARIEVKGRA